MNLIIKTILALVYCLVFCSLKAKAIPKKYLKDDYVFKQCKIFIWLEDMGNYKLWV